ncbi:MAG: hypothetical protein CMJ49_10210, partial [Planctomycetaceae bacterium]|nr:hypothetical protein [Planctomycetaceae bacterium]
MSNDASNDWTSRRRLLTALDAGQPDRVPISTYELVGYDSISWYNQQPSYQRLMDRIRADTDCLAMWNPGRRTAITAQATTSILCSAYPVPIDVHTERDGPITRSTWTMHTPRGDLQRVTQDDDNVLTTWIIEHWCKSLDDVDKAMSVPYEPVDPDPADHPRIAAEVGDHGLIMASLGDPALIVAELMSFQEFTLWAHEEPDHFARAVEQVAERARENLDRELAACVVDLYRICGPEYFTPPYLPPEAFARFVVPYVTQMTRQINDAGGRVRLHCHGKIGRVLDMILDTGPDGIDPCEPPPDGDIELDAVKRRCAERGVCVFGNIELKVLEHGTTQEIRDTVRGILDQAKDGGGFVIMPTAGPINTPLSPQTESNYLTFIDAALE